MSVNEFIQKAMSAHKKTEKNDTGVNQNKVKSEALEIFDSIYDELIVLYMRDDKDRQYFLDSFATALGEIFPRKTKKKSKSRKKQQMARQRFSKDGMFYWKSKEFKGLSESEQNKWRKSWKDKYPWLPTSKEEEALMKSGDPEHGIRFYTSSDFAKMSKTKQREWKESTVTTPKLPLNAQEYEEFLTINEKFKEKYAAFKAEGSDDSKNDSQESD